MTELSVGIPTEAEPETRVAMVPLAVASVTGAGLRVVLARGAGTAAGYPDLRSQEKGAVMGSEDEAWGCDVVLRIPALGAGTGKLGAGQTLIGLCGALFAPPALAEVSRQGHHGVRA
jgi:H+-translocating NAD(P) transhydrogenase subunit alpha